jgi:hypothetical protein
MRPTEVVVLARKNRWLAWRDLVTLLLAISVVLLVRQVGDLRSQLDATNATREQQFAEFNDRIDALRDQLAQSQADSARKDARIKQLTDQLIDLGVTPVPALTPDPSPEPTSTATPKPSPSPSPKPRPRPSRTPTASPTPCLPLPACVTLPPQALRALPPFRLALLVH